MIFLVFGELCSGKGVFSAQLAKLFNGKHITTSDIVKSVSGFKSREQLQTTSHMAQEIVDSMCDFINENIGSTIVIDGIRQQQIVIYLENELVEEQIVYVWLDTDQDIRKYRYELRLRHNIEQNTQEYKDSIGLFERAEQGDIDLGLSDLKEWLYDSGRVNQSNTIKNFTL